MAYRTIFAVVLVALASVSIVGQRQAKPAQKAAQDSTAKKPAGMTNQDVIDMVKAGFGDDFIIAQVKQATAKAFDLSVKEMIGLKTAGVSERVITIMSGAEPGPPPASKPAETVAAPAPATAAAETPLVKEIGVYFKKEGQWTEMAPEVVNWKTGGALKNWATLKIVKKDVNGTINGPRSRTVLTPTTEILVYTADGIAISEYQLLRLRLKDNRREFRTVTGGVLNSSGGALRDLVPFESRKIAVRTNVVILPNLGAGEYGFLSPGAANSASASAQLGKMYTFRIE